MLRSHRPRLHHGDNNDENEIDGKVILVAGACGLDRLLAVQNYPSADSKIQTTGYHEFGGGNAANTATAMALLSGSTIFGNHHVSVKLCTKIGDDSIGRQVMNELQRNGVDLSSPLFQVGTKGTTTGLTNVIVSNLEQTRTCIHTPGTCGELTPDDVRAVNMNEVFHRVVHIHVDGRHSDASLLLVREAKQRGISVSIDVEKDRNSKSQDEMLEVADIICTNSDQIETYLNRLSREYEAENDLRHLTATNVSSSILSDVEMAFYAHIVKPSSYFTRCFSQQGKVVVITRGKQGALSITTSLVTEKTTLFKESTPFNQIEISRDTGSSKVVEIRQTISECENHSERSSIWTATYHIHDAGILTSAHVVDTTGAGDAFIGGYILSRFILGLVDDPLVCLQFGCWVGGKKVRGVGARSALPTAAHVDAEIGRTKAEFRANLSHLIGDFPLHSHTDGMLPVTNSWESFEHAEK